MEVDEGGRLYSQDEYIVSQENIIILNINKYSCEWTSIDKLSHNLVDPYNRNSLTIENLYVYIFIYIYSERERFSIVTLFLL